VESIGTGMMGVQGISTLVQQLANRATLVALHAVTAGSGSAGLEPGLAEELRHLVHEVRDAADRTSQLSFEIEAAVEDASTVMRDARERALEKLDKPAATPAAHSNPRAYDDSQRLLERVLEMVQDATRKGERLSAAGERASRAAERLARRVAEESLEAQALVVRMMPVGGAEAAQSPSRELRLLEHSSTEAAHGAADSAARQEKRP
jgi:methyl-accepting chemotaxis protein